MATGRIWQPAGWLVACNEANICTLTNFSIMDGASNRAPAAAATTQRLPEERGQSTSRVGGGPERLTSAQAPVKQTTVCRRRRVSAPGWWGWRGAWDDCKPIAIVRVRERTARTNEKNHQRKSMGETFAIRVQAMAELEICNPLANEFPQILANVEF